MRSFPVIVAAFSLAAGALAARRGAGAGTPAPPFPTADPEHWIGVPPTLGSLRGRVVLLDVWTFG